MADRNSNDKKSVFALTERDGKTYWTRIGIGWVNKDQSLTIALEALPVSGRLQVRKDEEREERSDRSDRSERRDRR